MQQQQETSVLSGSIVVHHSKNKRKRKEKKKKEQQQTQQIPMVIHLHQLGLTTAVDTPKLRYGELNQLLGALTKEVATRNQNKKEHVNKLEAEQVEFLTKCRNLIQTVLPGIKTDTDKPLERAYQLLESVMLNLHTQM